MKTGRNDPCPCGSGKKYKKCCIDKLIRRTSRTNIVPFEESETCFEHIKDDAELLDPILSSYHIEDLTKALFCINSWPSNRSALAQTLTLNQAICDIQHFGNKRIDDYEAFESFFETISAHLPITPWEDLTLNDFGEVKIIVDGESFPLVLGTGHEHVFGAMSFLPALAAVIEMTEEAKAILRYNRLIINTLAGSVSTNKGANDEIKFEVPSSQFWKATSSLFASEEFVEHASKAYAIVGYQKCPIEMRHFFIHKGKWYPLYNASILVDLYKMLLSNATEEEYHQHIRLTIRDLLENTFNAGDNPRSRVLIEPRIIETSTGRAPTNNRLSFMTVDKDRVLVAINLDDFRHIRAVENETQEIACLHELERLGFMETYYREELGGGYGFEIKPEMSIHYLLFEPHTDITTQRVFLGSTADSFTCSALDLIYMLGFMDGFDELLDFIEYDLSQKSSIIAFGGKSSLFFAWKNSHRHIESGAIEYNHISVLPGMADNYVFAHYADNLFDYPFSLKSEMFSFPLAWKAQTGTHGFTEFMYKSPYGCVGEGKMISPSTFLFLTHDLTLFRQEDFSPQNLTALRTINELNRRLFNRYTKELNTLTSLRDKILQVVFIPNYSEHSTLNSEKESNKDKKYVYSNIQEKPNMIELSYSVKLEKLMSAIAKANDRSVECEYFLELIKPLQDSSSSLFTTLERAVWEDSSLDKEVDVLTIEQDYYYSDEGSNPKMGPVNFSKARKKIAEVCFAADIKPGIYHGKDATKVVRQMQKRIVSFFEDMLQKYNRENLHLMTLSYYATQVHGAMMNLKRYRSFRTLEPSAQQEFDDSVRTKRENFKRNARTALYLLESNLVLDHRDTTNQCKESEFTDLLALADWLVTLQDNSDVSYFTELDVSIEVDSEFKINTILSEIAERQHQVILSRKYDQEEYGIKHDSLDEDHLIKCMDAFSEDTSVEFGILLSFLKYLQLSVVEATFTMEVHPNVFEASKEDLIGGFHALVENHEHDYSEKVSNVLDFITLDCDELKCLNGEKHDVLPVWDREKRNNRFEVKPMLVMNDKYVFSPVIMKQLGTFWENGFLEWYPPFEIGLDNLKRELTKWKKRYEDEMVRDIACLLDLAGFKPVYPEIEFNSRFPRHNFPDIGDYDVIAINQPRKEIWLIEAKVLQKVGSVFEDQMQQKGFFFSDKNDEKFQRRIDYIKDNQADIAAVLGLDIADYTIVPHMVTNKLFLSRYKPIDFPIITYHELTRKLEEYQL